MANVFAGRFRKILLTAWVVIGSWDTMVAQFLPRSWAVMMPNVYDILAKTSGFLDWWVWLVAGTAMTTIFSIEYAHRRNGVLVSSPTSEKNRMSAPVIGLVIFGLGFLGCLVWWISSGKPLEDNPVEADPLRWSFLGDTTHEKNFLMGKTTEYGVEIRGFQATGKNETGAFLKGMSGHVESLRSGKKYPLFAVHRDELVPLADFGVPVGNQFMVRAPFFGGSGIPVVQFLSQFGSLKFVFKSNGSTYTRTFSAEHTSAQANWLDGDLKPKPKRSEAGVIPLPARTLSDQQRATVAETIRDSAWQPDSLWVRYFSPCEECRRYGNALKAALTFAGWNGDFGQTLDQREDLFGLKLFVSDLDNKPATARLIGLALEKASVPFDWAAWPSLEDERTILFVYPQD